MQVVNATRTPLRDNKPGIVKIEFKDTDTKVAVLRAKSQLGNDDRYRRVFIRSAQSHVERVSQKNTMAVLREMGLEDKFRFTGNGKLVPKQPTNPTVPTMAATGTPGPPPVGAPPMARQFPPHTGMQQMAMNNTAPAPPFVYHGHQAQPLMSYQHHAANGMPPGMAPFPRLPSLPTVPEVGPQHQPAHPPTTSAA